MRQNSSLESQRSCHRFGNLPI